MDTGRRTGGGRRGRSPQLALVGVKARLVPSQVAVSRMDASKAAQRLFPAGSSRSGCVTSRCVPAAHGRDGVKRQVASPSARDVVPSTRRPCPSRTAISASPTELMGTFTLARARRGEVGRCAPEVLRLAALAALDPRDEAGRSAVSPSSARHSSSAWSKARVSGPSDCHQPLRGGCDRLR